MLTAYHLIYHDLNITKKGSLNVERVKKKPTILFHKYSIAADTLLEARIPILTLHCVTAALAIITKIDDITRS